MTVSPLEVTANAVTGYSIFLAGRNSVHTWWTGIAGCLLFLIVFVQARLYADAALQLFFVATSAWGWWQWLRGGQHRAALQVTRTSRSWLLGCLVAGALTTVGYGALLHALTDAYAPFVDSAVLSGSVVAQLLLTRRRVENWPFWLLVNTIAVPLFAMRGLSLTALLYAAYGLNALVSWRRWHRLATTPARAL